MGRTTWIRTGLCLLAVLALLCMGLALAESPTVSLRIKGAEDTAGLLKNESAEVEISAPGATAVRYMINDEFGENLHEWGEWQEWSQNGEICFDWDNWEEQAYVLACFDADPSAEDAVWVRSNTVNLDVTTYGQLAAHTIAHAESVPRGTLLEVQVQGLDARAEWTYVSVYQAEEGRFHQNHLGDVIYIPTAQLEPGSYCIGVGSRAVGYEDNWTEDTFTVTEPEEDIFAEDVHWQFTAGEIATHEEVSFSASAMVPDVAYTVVEVFNTEFGYGCGRWESGECATNDCVVGRFSADRAGSYEFVCYLYREGEEEPFEVSSSVLNVIADGTLDPVQIQNMPKQIALLESVNGTIVPVVDAEWYSFNIDYNRDGEWEWFENHDQKANNTTIHYDGDRFDEVGLYCLSVGAHAHGKNSSYTDAYFVVRPAEDKSVTLSIGGETETLNCVANTQLPLVVVTAPGGSDVQYFNGYEWRGINHLNNEIGYSGSESFNGGDTTVLARAWFDEPGEWRYSKPVTVHAETTGVVGDLSLSLAQNEVARGNALEVSFEAAENATQYDLRIQTLDYDEYFCINPEPGTYRLPTAMLEPGDYYVTVDYSGPGCDWCHVEEMFTVTAGVEPTGIIASLSANEIECSKRVILSVYAPGAEMIRIFNENNPKPDEWYDEREGDSFICDLNWDHPETLFFSVSVSYDGGKNWSPRENIGEVRVSSDEQLARPEITLSSSLINAGTDVEFSFARVANATQYWYELRDNDILNGNQQIMDGWYYVPATVKLPAELFRAGHTYRLEVHVGAPGYETNDASYSLAVRPNWDGDINLYVNGETESVEGWASDGFYVVADAPENATAIIVSDGMDWHWQKGNHFEEDFGYGFNGEVTLIARYTIDKIDLDAPWWENAGWAGYSNPVTLTIHCNGNMPEVEATVPESVTRVDFMEIQITNAATFLNGAYENLWLHAEAYFPDEDRWYGCYDWDGEGTIMLPTAELEAGTYELHVRAGADGYVGSTSVYKFSVNAPENDAIRFVIDKTEVVTGEEFTVSVYAPGADQVKLFEGYGEIDCRNGNTYVQPHSHDEATELRFHAEAHMLETDAWVKTEPITVTVTAPYGSITAAKLGLVMPTRLEADKELTIAWNDLGLQHYDVEIVRLRDDVRVWHSWNDQGEIAVTVPTVMPEDTPENVERLLKTEDPILQAGEFYRVNLYFQRYGYNSLHIEKQIVVVSDDMYAQGLTLMVDGQTEACTTLVNVDVPVRITAPQNATAILVWNGYDWEWHDGSDTSFHIAWGDANERLVYAKYTTEKIVDGKDWWEYNWSGLSNIVSVNVTRNGYVEAPVVELSSATPLRGEALSFTVSNPESGFNWTVYDPVDDWSWDWSDWEEKTSHEINTFDLQVDRTYLLCVDKYGSEGYEGTGVEIPFTVGAADKIYDGNVLELPTGLKAIEEEAFAGISARTVVIPEGCTSIGSLAFADCGSLKYVVIPDSVTSIEGDAFARSNVTFVCNGNSAAADYARNHSIPTRSHD